MNVLIVDDDPLVARAIGRVLRGLAQEITYVFSGQDALKFLATDPVPDVIVSDFDMPYMTGVQLWEQLEPSIQKKFIFHTGNPSKIPEHIPNVRIMKPGRESLVEAVKKLASR